jgi:hypothetical protein
LLALEVASIFLILLSQGLMGLIRIDYSSGPRLRLRSFVAAALSGDLRVDPFGRRGDHVTSGAWREETLHDADLAGIGVPISHLIFRERRGEVLEKDWIPTGTWDESVVRFEHLRPPKTSAGRISPPGARL